jgi:chromate transporter
MSPLQAWQICAVFGTASLMSVGGGNAIVPQLQRETVLQHNWLTAGQFADSFAIAQVAPGPSSLLVTLLGYRAAGLGGALLATAAMVLPTAVLVWAVTRLWLRSGHARWHLALERGIAPVAVGLVAASGVVIARSVDHAWPQWALSAAATAVLSATKVNPIYVVLAGGAAGLWLG